jgi:peptidoglycan hydrolase-like protein with peptidoglycan-binding domain
MSSAANPQLEDRSEDSERPSLRAPRRGARARLAAAVLIAALALGGAAYAADRLLAGGGSSAAGATNPYPTSLATVADRTLTSQVQVTGSLGYASNYSIVSQAQGDITWLPSAGQVISQGQQLYQVNGQPVVLLYGSVPAYRSPSDGMSGADVKELNADLVALGYVSSSKLNPSSGYFGWWTRYGVEQLQAALGVAQTGTLQLGQAVFLPTAARVTSVAQNVTLGGPAQPGATVLSASSTTRIVTIALDSALQSDVKVGDKVTIVLPHNVSTPGVVSYVGSVATVPAGGTNNTPSVTVDVTPTDPAATGNIDQAPVLVSITTASADNALVVPVTALLAQPAGGYAVEVVRHGVHRLVRVTLGIFDDADGLVQVTSSGLASGDQVVVPGL